MGAEDLNVAEVAEVAEVAVANGMNNETDEVFGTGFVIFMISRIWNLSDWISVSTLNTSRDCPSIRRVDPNSLAPLYAPLGAKRA